MTATTKFRTLLTLLSGFFLAIHHGAPQAADGVSVLEEVVVTATRRNQTVSQVPLAITAFTGDQLQVRGIGDMQDLARVSPSLVITTSTSETTGTEVRIRGIGTSGNNPGLEPSVGIFVDNVYRSRSGLAAGDLLDIASVEILRGPQGTLFGRNTSAGTISINTLKPEFEWGGYGEGTVQNYNGYQVAAGVTGPLLEDTLAFRLSASYNERDGYVSDRLVSSREFYDRNRANARGQLLWRPVDDVDVRLIVDYKHKDEHCCAADYTIAGPTAAAIEALGGIVKTDPFAYKAQTSFDSQDDLDEWGASVETNWAVAEDLSLTWIGAYRDADAYANVDSDTSNIDLVKGTNWNQNDHFMSQEVRLNGVSGRVDWLVGAYYYTDDIDVDWQLLYGADFGPYFNLLLGVPAFLFPEGVGDQSRYFKQDGEGWALFTHNIVELTDNYDLVVGFRWSDDNKDATARVVNDSVHCTLIPFVPFCPVPDLKESRGEGEPSGTLKLVRNLDIGNIYVGYSRGYKAGGFNLDRDAATTGFEFDPETVDSYEAGLKWSVPDRTLEANTAIFYSEFQNYQINEFNGVSFATTNAARVNSTGAELELSWLPLTGLVLDAGVTWSNTQYDEHPVSNELGNTLEGKRVPFAPEWSATGSISYQMPIGSFTGFGVINASYMGEHNTNETLEPEAEVGSYTIVNARLGLRTADSNWEVSLWGKNIFEEDYNSILFNTVLQDGSWSSFRGEPRTYGASVRYDF
ncbi:MAG: TonB-dependent receptor [Gammaproteobacteria bacterium]|nr:TonB-dependent receptor [Gammaproteobacteria bacterium]